MLPSKRIIVEAGAILRINNSEITSFGGAWDGIMVYGNNLDYEKSHYDIALSKICSGLIDEAANLNKGIQNHIGSVVPGIVYTTGSTISNSIFGISLYHTNIDLINHSVNMRFFLLTCRDNFVNIGGLIYARNNDFINNVKCAIGVLGNGDNHIIQQNRFKRTLNGTGEIGSAFIIVDNLSTPLTFPIQSNTFENLTENNTDQYNGIVIRSAQVSVRSNTLTGLRAGIMVDLAKFGIGANKSISNNTFNKCSQAIVIRASDYVPITSNLIIHEICEFGAHIQIYASEGILLRNNKIVESSSNTQLVFNGINFLSPSGTTNWSSMVSHNEINSVNGNAIALQRGKISNFNLLCNKFEQNPSSGSNTILMGYNRDNDNVVQVQFGDENHSAGNMFEKSSTLINISLQGDGIKKYFYSGSANIANQNFPNKGFGDPYFSLTEASNSRNCELEYLSEDLERLRDECGNLPLSNPGATATNGWDVFNPIWSEYNISPPGQVAEVDLNFALFDLIDAFHIEMWGNGVNNTWNDSIENVLKMVPTFFSQDMLFRFYVQQSRFVDAYNQLDIIDSIFGSDTGRHQFVLFNSFLLDYFENGRELSWLINNLSAIEDVANDESHACCDFARSLVQYTADLDENNPDNGTIIYGLPVLNLIDDQTYTLASTVNINIFPNPTSTSFNVIIGNLKNYNRTLEISVIQKETLFEVYNSLQFLIANEGSANFSFGNGFIAGEYFFILKENGAVVDQIILIKQ
jgi:hypothetical protein